MKSSKINIQERGWAAHFIRSDQCTFTRNTLVERGTKKIIISTVGAFKPSVNSEVQPVGGLKHFYETKAFRAVYLNPYWEADPGKELKIMSLSHLNYYRYDSDIKANEMHDDVVKEIIKKYFKTKKEK